MTSPDRPVILAVEDEAVNAALLRAILAPTGYDLHVVGNLAAARDWLGRRTPDVLLLDRHLPDGDGLALVHHVRLSPALRACRVVLVSASVLPSDRAAAEAAGCDGFIPKPIRVRVLLDEIACQLGATGARSPA